MHTLLGKAVLTGKKSNAVGNEEQTVLEIIVKHKNTNLQVRVLPGVADKIMVGLGNRVKATLAFCADSRDNVDSK